MRNRVLSFLLVACTVFVAGAGDVNNRPTWPSTVYGSMIVDDIRPLEVIDGIDAWWKFNEGSGSTAKDLGGNGYDGTLADGASFSSDYVTVGGDTPVDIVNYPAAATLAGASKFTIACDVYITTSTGSQLGFVYAEETSTVGYARVHVRWSASDNKMQLLWRDSANDPTGSGSSIKTTATVSTGNWYFVAARFDSDADEASITLDGTNYDWAGGSFLALGTSTSANIASGRNAASQNDRNQFRLRKCKRFDRFLTDDELVAVRDGY